MSRPQRTLPTGRPSDGSIPRSASYDLSEDWRLAQRASRYWNAAFPIAGLLLGFFFLLGAVVTANLFLYAVGALLSSLAVAGLYFTYETGIVGVDLGEDGITVRRLHQKTLHWPWDAPELSIDVTEITVDPATVAHPPNPQAVHPQWISFPRFLGTTTIPKDLETNLIHWAESRDLELTRTPVLLFWTGTGKSGPPTLSSRDIGGGDATTPNGQVTRIRPRGAGSSEAAR